MSMVAVCMAREHMQHIKAREPDSPPLNPSVVAAHMASCQWVCHAQAIGGPTPLDPTVVVARRASCQWVCPCAGHRL